MKIIMYSCLVFSVVLTAMEPTNYTPEEQALIECEYDKNGLMHAIRNWSRYAPQIEDIIDKKENDDESQRIVQTVSRFLQEEMKYFKRFERSWNDYQNISANHIEFNSFAQELVDAYKLPKSITDAGFFEIAWHSIGRRNQSLAHIFAQRKNIPESKVREDKTADTEERYVGIVSVDNDLRPFVQTNIKQVGSLSPVMHVKVHSVSEEAKSENTDLVFLKTEQLIALHQHAQELYGKATSIHAEDLNEPDKLQLIQKAFAALDKEQDLFFELQREWHALEKTDTARQQDFSQYAQGILAAYTLSATTPPSSFFDGQGSGLYAKISILRGKLQLFYAQEKEKSMSPKGEADVKSDSPTSVRDKKYGSPRLSALLQFIKSPRREKRNTKNLTISPPQLIRSSLLEPLVSSPSEIRVPTNLQLMSELKTRQSVMIKKNEFD